MKSLARTTRATSTQCLKPQYRLVLAQQCARRSTSARRSAASLDERDRRHQEAQIKSLRSDLSDVSAKKVRGNHDRYRQFQRLVETRFKTVLDQLGPWSEQNVELKALNIASARAYETEVDLFRRRVITNAFQLSKTNVTARQQNPFFWSWRNAFMKGNVGELTREIRFTFTSFLLRSQFTQEMLESHKRLADFRFPYEWFPATRQMQRTVHLHVGPTNSGKTYHALKAMEAAQSGIYAGPLRMLAHETYSRLAAKGRRVALVTGEEQRMPEGIGHFFSACTVEMTPLNRRVDVAVIDEIQMIADTDRGWAWTQAFLGVQAREVHLCGEERAVELIQDLCGKIGDKCIVHRYERLSPLQPMNESLGGDFRKLKKGDAIVSFSRLNLHALKAGIEEATGKRCAIVYGSLPPQSRTEQAALFNDPDNDYDFLVASDAIGMGLNLEIQRIIFETTVKWDGMGVRKLSNPEFRQIGGRAGRYRTAVSAIREAEKQDLAVQGNKPANEQPKSVGLITTLYHYDLPDIRQAFQDKPEPIKTAGIFPPSSVIEQFSAYFTPNTPLSFVLLRLRDIGRISPSFHLCEFDDALQVADAIQHLPMNISDRCIFLTAPVAFRDHGQLEALQAMAKCVSDMQGGHLLDILQVDLELLDSNKDIFPGGPPEYLRRLEALHKAVTLYLWLSYRFTGVFVSQHLAFHVKDLVEAKIRDELENVGYEEEAQKAKLANMRAALTSRQKQSERYLGTDPEDVVERETVGDWSSEGHEEPLVDRKLIDTSSIEDTPAEGTAEIRVE